MNNVVGPAPARVLIDDDETAQLLTGILEDGTIKVRIAAAPADNQANEKLVKFLAEVLGVAPSKVEIVAGQTGRDKLSSVIEIDERDVQARLSAFMA